MSRTDDVSRALLALVVDDHEQFRSLLAVPGVANALVEPVEFHRLGFQAVEAVRDPESDGRPGDVTPPAAGADVWSSYVRAVSIRRAFTGHVTASALRVVSEVLGARGVPWAVIKGPALLAYTPPGETRDFRDLDILVGGDRLNDAVAALEAGGATLLHRNFVMLREVVSGELGLALPNGLALDLHWHLLHTAYRRSAFSIDTAPLVARAAVRHPGRLDAPVLDPEDNLLQIGVHAGLTGGYRLLWVRDVRNALRFSRWDFDVVVDRARSTDTALVLAVVLDHVHRITREPAARELADALAPRSIWRAALRAGAWVDARYGRQATWGLHRSTRRSAVTSVAEYLGSQRDARRSGPSVRQPWRAEVAAEPRSLWTEVDSADRTRYFRAVEQEAARTTPL